MGSTLYSECIAKYSRSLPIMEPEAWTGGSPINWLSVSTSRYISHFGADELLEYRSLAVI
jgi:hypothetical protein